MTELLSTQSQVSITGIIDIDSVWEQVKPLILKALEYSNGELGIDDIYEKLKTKNMQLWICFEDIEILSAATTEIIIYPKKKICRVVTLGGHRMAEWFYNLIQFIEAWGRHNKINGMEVIGRRGWERIGKRIGYGSQQSILYKELKYEYSNYNSANSTLGSA